MRKTIKATGSCLCGAVTISAPDASTSLGACHCGNCRTWGGGPFLSLSCGDSVEIEGRNSVRIFESSAWAERGFCKTCGTHLFYRFKDTQNTHIPVGLFADSVCPTFRVQLFFDRKPRYYGFANETKEITEAQVFERLAFKK